MNKKTLIALATAIVSSVVAHAADAVRVVNSAREETLFVLADSPKVEYTAQGLIITSGGTAVTLPSDDMYTFTIVESASINSAVTTQIEISRSANAISIDGLRPGASVAAYTIDGRVVAHAVANAQGIAELNLSSQRGSLIISTPTQSFKIVK